MTDKTQAEAPKGRTMTCIAKTCELYFTHAERQQHCSHNLLSLPNFWKCTKSGILDAEICSLHRSIALQGSTKSYLAEQIRKALMSEV